MDFLNTPEKLNRRLVHNPMGRFGEAVEQAKAVVFCQLRSPLRIAPLGCVLIGRRKYKADEAVASDDSSYINGTDFLVDGGLHACYVVSLFAVTVYLRGARWTELEPKLICRLLMASNSDLRPPACYRNFRLRVCAKITNQQSLIRCRRLRGRLRRRIDSRDTTSSGTRARTGRSPSQIRKLQDCILCMCIDYFCWIGCQQEAQGRLGRWGA